MSSPLTKMIIISMVLEMISNELKISIEEARDLFYKSTVCKTLSDDDSGLYGESPYRTFELFMMERNKG